jgi:hypothetical protein
MRMKGFALFGTGLSTILAFLAIVLSVGLITAFSGGIADFIEASCEKNPGGFLCGGGDEVVMPLDYDVAKESTEALVCAVNSVSAGKLWSSGEGASGEGGLDCTKYYEGQELTADWSLEETEYTIVKKLIKRSDNCDQACKDEEDELCEGVMHCTVKGGTYKDRVIIADKCECDIAIATTPYVACDGGGEDYQCKVYNFQLPQKVTNAQDAIAYYGDPQFLLYWQKFPLSEDTWTFKDAWWMYGIIIAATALPVGRMGGTLAKASAKGIGASATTFFKTYTKKRATSVGLLQAGKITKRALSAEMKALQKSTRNSIKNALVTEMKEKATAGLLIPGRSLFKQGMKVTLAGGAVVALTVADIVDSWYAKLDTYNNQMVLKLAGSSSPETFDLPKSGPVIVEFKGGVFKKSTPTFMLASPCYISSMVVKKEANVNCERFTYDVGEEGEMADISCEGASVGKENYPSCYEPDEYLKFAGGARLSEDAEDPVLDYILGFRSRVPDYIDIGGNRSTVVISEKVVMSFSTQKGKQFEDTDMIVDTSEGVKRLPVSPKEGSERFMRTGSNYYEAGTVRYGGLEIDVYFKNETANADCGITEEGMDKVGILAENSWGTLFGEAPSPVTFKNLYGVGCYGYFNAFYAGSCDDLKIKDPQELDRIKEESKVSVSHPAIEYEEGCGLGGIDIIGTCGNENVFYYHDGSGWKWKSKDATDTYIPVSRLSDSDCDTYDIETVHIDIMEGLIGKGFEEGIDVFKGVLSLDTDSRGRDTSDDYLKNVDYSGDETCMLLEKFTERFETDKEVEFRYVQGEHLSMSSIPSVIDTKKSVGVTSYQTQLIDLDMDYTIDSIGINSGHGAIRNQNIDFIDMGSGFGSYSMRRCNVPDGVIVKDVEKVEAYEDNYCFDKPTGKEITLKILGTSVVVVGSAAAAFFGDGAALAIISGSGLVGGSLDVWGDISSKWPNAG